MRFSALYRRWRRHSRRGSAAIEFAFVAPIFFALMFGIIETGTMFFAQFTLQNATTTVARMIRTGAAANMADTSQATNYSNVAQCANPAAKGYASSSAWFTAQICCGVRALLSCSNLQVDVSSYTGGFSGASAANNDPLNQSLPVNQRTLDPNLNRYNTGAACDVVLVRAFYKWDVVTPGLYALLELAGAGASNGSATPNSSGYLVNMGGGAAGSGIHLIVASAAFRNEPFTNGVSGC